MGCAVSGSADLRDPVFPGRLAVRVTGPRPGGLTIAFSANTPNPRDFRFAIAIAMPIAALFRAWTEFLILDGVDQFPSGHRHGAGRPRRRPAVDEPQ